MSRTLYSTNVMYTEIRVWIRDGNGPGRPRAGPGRAGPELPGPRAETGRNGPKDFSFKCCIEHCARAGNYSYSGSKLFCIEQMIVNRTITILWL